MKTPNRVHERPSAALLGGSRRDFLRTLGIAGAGVGISAVIGGSAKARVVSASAVDIFSVGAQLHGAVGVSPDGHWMAFAAGDVARQGLYFGPSSGPSGAFQRVVAAGKDEISSIRATAVSHDGSKVAFARRTYSAAADSGAFALEEVDLKTGAVSQIAVIAHSTQDSTGMTDLTGLVYGPGDQALFYPHPKLGLVAVDRASGATSVAVIGAGYASGLRARADGSIEYLMATKSNGGVSYSIVSVSNPGAVTGAGMNITSVGNGCQNEGYVAVYGTSYAYSAGARSTKALDVNTAKDIDLDPPTAGGKTWLVPGAFLDESHLVAIEVAENPGDLGLNGALTPTSSGPEVSTASWLVLMTV